jgi:hypothetical protein
MSQSPIIKGVTTIVWGTSNILAAPSGAVVESISITPKNSAPIEIEGNEGLTNILVILSDGFNAKVSALYDSSKTWPLEGSTVNISIPNYAPGSNTNNTAATFTCVVGSTPELTYGRKKESMIALNLIYRPNVSLS